MESLSVRAPHFSISVDLEINCPEWVFMIVSVGGFFLKHWEFHIFFQPILFTENIVIIRAVTGIRYRIFGVESINIMELIHEGDETVHIWTVLVHINNRYILIRHTDLDIIRREQLVISHIVLFDSHESSGMIRLGIAIASISTDLDLFYIFIQLWQIFLKFFIMALLDGLSMSFTSDKRCFIQLPDFYVFRCGFL